MIVTEKTKDQFEENFSKNSPVATYVKRIPAKIEIRILDIVSGKPKDVILYGNEGEVSSYINLYTDSEKVFFVREQKNIRHINGDRLMETTAKSVPTVIDHVAKTDEVLLEALSHLSKLKSFVAKEENDTEALAIRLLKLAEDNDRPASHTEFLKKHLSTIQGTPIFSPVED